MTHVTKKSWSWIVLITAKFCNHGIKCLHTTTLCRFSASSASSAYYIPPSLRYRYRNSTANMASSHSRTHGDGGICPRCCAVASILRRDCCSRSIDHHWKVVPPRVKEFILDQGHLSQNGFISFKRLVNFWSSPQNIDIIQYIDTCGTSLYLVRILLRILLIEKTIYFIGVTRTPKWLEWALISLYTTCGTYMSLISRTGTHIFKTGLTQGS